MLKLFLLTISTLALVSTGCSKEAPACGDADTKKLVISIFMKEAKVQVRQNSELASGRRATHWDEDWEIISKKMNVSVDNIRTKDFKKDVGSYACAADLHFQFKNQAQVLPITYTSELAADKPGGFYVEVYGLR